MSMKSKHRRKIKKYIITIFLILAVWFTIHTIYTISDGRSYPSRKADVAVILGNKVNEDGSLSERLRQRLETGIKLYNDDLVKYIVVSGGLGKEGFYEGDKMREYLLEHNIPDSIIIVDNNGNNTRLTVRNFEEINKRYSFEKMVVVSQYFHITRTKLLFRQYGFTNLQGASPDYFEWRDLYAIPREFVAFYQTVLKS